jgi:hypothetical protein
MLRRAMDLGGFHQVRMGRSLGNWRTGYCQSVMGVLLWEIQEEVATDFRISNNPSKPL